MNILAVVTQTTLDLGPLVYGVVVPALTPVMLVLVGWGINRAADLFHVSKTNALRQRLVDTVDNGIMYAENRAAAHGLTITTDEKIAAAVNYVTPKAADAIKKLDAGDHLRDLVIARLGVATAPVGVASVGGSGQ